MHLHAGTSGYSYKPWIGPFYPEGTAQKVLLEAYAAQLPSVEINNTFYRMPKRHVVENWRSQVPDTFRFVIKASRRITHFSRLKKCAEPLGYLHALGDRLDQTLGAFLFQLPPNLKADVDTLDRFLKDLRPETPCAFEFRHESWLDEGVLERLRNFGTAALVFSDDEDGVEAPPELVKTAPHAYLRLRRPSYSDDDLTGWLSRLEDAGFESAFVFFKHEDEAAGPKMALRMLELAKA